MNGDSRLLVCAIRGPVILITVGTLFALDHLTPLSFQQTWPAILIVVGLLGLGSGFGRRSRVEGVPPAASASPNTSPNFPPGVRQ